MTLSPTLFKTQPLVLSPRAQDILKIIALVTMTLDHMKIFFWRSGLPLYDLCAVVGRFAFPIFAVLIAYNLATREVPIKKYILPMLGAGIAAQYPFVSVGAPVLNTMFTLLLGVFAFWILEQQKHRYTAITTPLALLFIFMVSAATDYQFGGPFLIPIAVYVLRANHQIAWFGLVVFTMLLNNFRMESMVVAALPTLLLMLKSVEGKRIITNRYLVYAYYPLHLFLIQIISR
jgi:hypothetical protein